MSLAVRTENGHVETLWVQLSHESTGKKVLVMGVLHVASSGFWLRLNDLLNVMHSESGYTTHYEYVRPSANLTRRERFIMWFYRKMMKIIGERAGSVGLSYQKTDFVPPMTAKNADVEVKEIVAGFRGSYAVFVLQSLLGIFCFKFMPRFLLKAMLAGAADGGMKSSSHGIGEEFLLHRRNRHAVEACLAEPGNVVMLWGADHVEGIVELLRAQGFTQSKNMWVPMFATT